MFLAVSLEASLLKVVEIMSFYVELLVCFLKVLCSLFVIKVGGASIL
jgi:hypothetical protein